MTKTVTKFVLSFFVCGAFLGLFCVCDMLGRFKQRFATCLSILGHHTQDLASVFITIPGSVSCSSFSCNFAGMITHAPHSRQSCQQLVHLVNELSQQVCINCRWPAILSPLNTEFFSLEIIFSLNMPLTHRISISVKALTPKLSPTPLPALASRHVTLTTPPH